MAASDTKELAQCLAFAYFAENPDYNDPNHEINFYTLFDRKQSISPLKIKYLSKTFPIDKVKEDFLVKRKVNPKTKKETVTYHITAKKVYKVALECIKKRLFRNKPLSDFYFLDQNDAFVALLKNICLTNIKLALGLPYKIDALSAVDIMVVSKKEKKEIEKTFMDAFADKTIALTNVLVNKIDYADLINQYVLSGDLFPISLKLPSILTITPRIKLVSFKRKPLEHQIDIDPYTKFITVILQNPSKTNQIINQCIEIDFNKFSLGDVLNWVFPVNFNYNKVTDPKTKQKLEEYHLRFNLAAQGHAAGWNGQFDKSTRKHKDTQWVGGVGVGTFEHFAKSYPEYSTVIKSLAKLRVEQFEKLMEQYPNADKNEVRKVSTVLGSNKIIHTEAPLRTLDNFFSTLGETVFNEYKMNVINTIAKQNKKYTQSEIKKYTDTKRQNYINAHFVHAQISYFLLMGGFRFKLYFKQRMFLTIFGLITKQTHKVFNQYDYISMNNIIKKEIKQNDDIIVAQFSAAPHYIIS